MLHPKIIKEYVTSYAQRLVSWAHVFLIIHKQGTDQRAVWMCPNKSEFVSLHDYNFFFFFGHGPFPHYSSVNAARYFFNVRYFLKFEISVLRYLILQPFLVNNCL